MVSGQDIESELRESIVRGELAPASRLRMEQLRSRFNVAFSPIREALSRLQGEGLVELEPNRGFRVTALSRDDLMDIAIARVAIETTALRESIEHGDDHWEAGVVGAMHRYRLTSERAFEGEAQLRAWEESHDALHAALIGACGSQRLLDLQRRLQGQHLRYRRLIVVPQVSSAAHIEEHERLVGLALARDADTAVGEVRKHMMITVDALEQAHFWQQQGGNTAG
jgi:GntR family transcriptional regulator, carbon starvation induced regulator